MNPPPHTGGWPGYCPPACTLVFYSYSNHPVWLLLLLPSKLATPPIPTLVGCSCLICYCRELKCSAELRQQVKSGGSIGACAGGAVRRLAPGKAAWCHATCSRENEVAIASTCMNQKNPLGVGRPGRKL